MDPLHRARSHGRRTEPDLRRLGVWRRLSWACVAFGLGLFAAALPAPRELGVFTGLALAAAGGLTLVAACNESDTHRSVARAAPNQTSADARLVRGVLDSNALSAHFQPIVWMPTSEV